METYHEGSQGLKKVKLGKLMKEFGSFAIKRENPFVKAKLDSKLLLTALKDLGKRFLNRKST